jgi:hypothetical protein
MIGRWTRIPTPTSFCLVQAGLPARIAGDVLSRPRLELRSPG